MKGLYRLKNSIHVTGLYLSAVQEARASFGTFGPIYQRRAEIAVRHFRKWPYVVNAALTEWTVPVLLGACWGKYTASTLNDLLLQQPFTFYVFQLISSLVIAVIYNKTLYRWLRA